MPSNISVFGHSAGVDWAMRAAISHPDVARVAVMVAPPPATVDRDTGRDSPEYAARRSEYFARRSAEQYRFVYGRNIPDWYSWDLTLQDVRYGDDVWVPYTKPGHKPMLLILGERDQPDGHEAVLTQFASVSQPKELMVLRRADHYANTAQSLGFVFYDVDVARQLTDGVASWIDQSR